MIHFEGEQAFPHPVAEVAERLSDARFLVESLPDAQVSTATADLAVWKLKPKLSFISGSLDARLEAVSREGAAAVQYRVFTKAIGASSTVATRLEFLPHADGARVLWTGDLLEVTGLLKMVPKGLLQSTAEKVIGDVWAAVAARLRQSLTG